MRARNSRIKSQPINQPINFTKPDRPAAWPSRLNRRARKRIRLITLAILSLIALSAGWMLGETVMGPSPADHSRPAVSVQGASEAKAGVAALAYAIDPNGNDKNGAKTATDPDLAAKADNAREPQSLSQDRNGSNGADVKDEKRRPGRKAAYSTTSRPESVSANARKGPGISAVTGPIKAVFRPLKRANPLRLRIW
jgi:hypothetical protein